MNIPEQYLPCHWFISANTGDVAQQLVDRAAFSWWSSVIHTLCCREIVPVWMEMVAYSQLSQLDYIHHTVNHPRNFKDPVAGVCINRVDRSGIWSQWILSKCIFMPLVVMQETKLYELGLFCLSTLWDHFPTVFYFLSFKYQYCFDIFW